MAVQINQRFPKCALCGKMIPLRAKPILLEQDRTKLSFCCEECFEMYQEAHEPAVSGQVHEEK